MYPSSLTPVSLAVLCFAAGGARGLVMRSSSCDLTLKTNGAVDLPVGQLSSGQARGGSGLSTTFTLTDSSFIDQQGRGCWWTPPTYLLQCDIGQLPDAGFTVGCDGVLSFNGQTTFYECATGEGDQVNIYKNPDQGVRCAEITLIASGCSTLDCTPTSLPATSSTMSSTMQSSSSSVQSFSTSKVLNTKPAVSSSKSPSSFSHIPHTTASMNSSVSPGFTSFPASPFPTAIRYTNSTLSHSKTKATTLRVGYPTGAASNTHPAAGLSQTHAMGVVPQATYTQTLANAPAEATASVIYVTVTEKVEGCSAVETSCAGCIESSGSSGSMGSVGTSGASGSNGSPGAPELSQNSGSGMGSGSNSDSGSSSGSDSGSEWSEITTIGSHVKPTVPGAQPTGYPISKPVFMNSSIKAMPHSTGTSLLWSHSSHAASATANASYFVSHASSSAVPTWSSHMFSSTSKVAASSLPSSFMPTWSSHFASSTSVMAVSSLSSSSVSSIVATPTTPTTVSHHLSTSPSTQMTSSTSATSSSSTTSSRVAPSTTLPPATTTAPISCAGETPAPACVDIPTSCPAAGVTNAGQFNRPRLIIPVDSSSPDTAAGTSYNGTASPSVSTIFTFDIPASAAGKKCNVWFLFPAKSTLETAGFDFSGSGALNFSLLNGGTTTDTTYSNMPSPVGDLGQYTVAPGNDYLITSYGCPTGSAMSVEMAIVSGGDTRLSFFQDYNPCPLGLFITTS
ncbi:ubiquitin 3 binding protein But2 C-terminal domain-containing protein [Xylariaceae sp. FL0016]|nr:ubiquitin 3 binding protein But2 C-terminal domain-containing protein [Xylariaceae sp. FL0016]